MRYRPITLILGVVGAALFFAPAIALVAGERAKKIENRPLADLPSLDLGWDVFPALTRWSTDHLPLRSNAVRLNTRLSENIFGEAPARIAATGPVGIGQAPRLAGQAKRRGGARPQSEVLKGSNGWLYLTQDFTSGCYPPWSIGQVVRSLRRLDSIIRNSGRRLIVVVPPDKSTIERSEIPDGYSLRACAERAHQERIAALRRLRLPGFVDMQSVLEAARRRQGKPIYQPLDSHWTQLGSILYGQSIAAKTAPRLLADTRVVRTTEQSPYGDLTTLIGDPQRSRQMGLAIERAGVSAPRTNERAIFTGGIVSRQRRTSTSTGAYLYPHRTMTEGSSFTGVSQGKLDPYFADITHVPQLLDAAGAGRLAEAERVLIAQIVRSKLVIFEQVEREFWGVRIASLLRPRFLHRLERALQGR